MALAVTIFVGLGIAFAGLAVWLPRVLGPKEPGPVKEAPYECGELPLGEPWVRYRAAYYVFALVFVVFDVEVVFLYPWAVIFKGLGVAGLVEMAVFVGVLALGLVYAWRRGLLRWT